MGTPAGLDVRRIRRRRLVLLFVVLGTWAWMPGGFRPEAAPAGFVSETLLAGLVEPTAMTFAPDGSLFVLERGGTIWRRPAGGATVDPVPVLQLPNVLADQGERGARSLALHPAYTTNGLLYVFYSHRVTLRNRVSRFTVTGGVGEAATESLIWEDDGPALIWHLGGSLAFGPDGNLYVATGDQLAAADAQSLSSARGKILRVTPTGSVPPDNPFADGGGQNVDAIWALGLRSPSLAFDRGTGTLYVTDAGGRDPAATVEEVNVGSPAANYGWPVCEGSCAVRGFTSPLHTYAHQGTPASIAGGLVYRGSQFPGEYVGNYFYGDFVRNWIRRLTFDRNRAVAADLAFEPQDGTSDGTFGEIVDLREGPDGALYYVDSGVSWEGTGTLGTVRRLRYEGSPVPASPAVLVAPVPGVVAAWSFDEGSGSLAADGTGRGYDGLVSGADWTAGRWGGALRFDGAGDYVAIPDSPALNVTESFTVSAWIRLAATGRWHVVFEHGAAAGNWGLFITSQGWLDVSEFGGADRSGGDRIRDTTVWHHVAWVKSGDTGNNVALYLDGVATARVSIGVTGASGPKRIGGDAWFADDFDGQIDNVRLYARALTAGEVLADLDAAIAALQDAAAPGVTVTAPATGATVTGTVSVTADASDDVGVRGVQFLLDGAPLGAEDSTAPYATAWDTTGASDGAHTLEARARDAAGNVTTSAPQAVTVDNVPSPTLTLTAPGDGATVIGIGPVAVSYVVTGDLSEATHAHFRLDGGSTLEDATLDGAYVLDGVAVGSHTLVGALARADESEIAASADAATFTMETDQAPAVTVTTPVAGATVTGTVSVTADASDDVGVTGVQFLLDGAPLGAEDSTAPYATAWDTKGASDGTHTLQARARDTAGGVTTSAEVAVTVEAPPGPPPPPPVPPPPAGALAAWAFDEGSGPVATDLSGGGHHGAVTGATWTTAGRYGSALSFDGADDYVTIPDAVALNATESFTLTAWVRRADTGRWQAVYQHGATPGYWGAYFTDGDRLGFSELNGTDLAGGPALTDTTTWRHVAWVKAGNSGPNVTLYLDGTAIGTLTAGGTGAGGPKRIGGDAWHVQTDDFAGEIDNVRLYGRALTAEEIRVDLAAPVVSAPPPSPPSVRITAPSEGETVIGSTVAVSYSTGGDQTNVTHAHFRLDGGPTLEEPTLDGVFQLTGVVVGTHTLLAVLARSDETEIAGADDAVAFESTASAPDVEPPAVALTAPPDSAVVGGVVTVSATATDNVAVARVQFLVNGASLGDADSTAPYEVSWDTRATANGTYVLGAVATDQAGLQTAAASRTLTTDNASGGADFGLRFYGNGVDDIDRVKIRIDDPSDSSPGPPVDVGATDFTLEFWLRANGAENAAPPVDCGNNDAWIYGNIVVDRDRNGGDRDYGVSIAGGVIVFGVAGEGTGSLTLCGTTNVLDDQWHHVAVQRRRADGWMQLFVDGALEAESDGPDGDVSYPDDAVPGDLCGGSCADSDPFLVIGAEKHDFGVAFPSYSGWFDELRLSTLLRYTGPFARPAAPFVSDAGTAALYDFNEGQGDIVGDRSAAQGGPSDGVRRFGGTPPGPDWVTEVPFTDP